MCVTCVSVSVSECFKACFNMVNRMLGRVVRICVREVSLTLVSYTHSSYIGMNVCGSAYDNGVWSMACVL